MPSDRKRGGRRTEIYGWRVKAGKHDVFSAAVKLKCEIFIRENATIYPVKLRLIPPNR